MPKVLTQGKTIECLRAANLRNFLLQNGIDLYNSGAKVINCRLIGSYAVQVQVEGEVKRGKMSIPRAVLPTSSFSYNQPAFRLSNSSFGEYVKSQSLMDFGEKLSN